MTDQNNALLLPGDFLRERREQAGLTPQYVADQLRISVSYVVALEQDQTADLPPTPFVIGYIRAYARLLGIDSDALVNSYLGREQAGSDGEVAETEPKTAKAGRQTLWLVLAGAGLLLVWVLSTAWLGTDSPEPEPVAQLPLTNLYEDDMSQDSDLVVDESVAEESAAEAEALTEAPAVSPSLAEDDGVMGTVAVTQETPVVQAVPAMDVLQLVFSGECWLEVTDAKGDVLAADLYQSGQQVSLQGRAPFDVMLGNARAVTVRINDEVVTLDIPAGRKTLRTQVQAAAAAN